MSEPHECKYDSDGGPCAICGYSASECLIRTPVPSRKERIRAPIVSGHGLEATVALGGHNFGCTPVRPMTADDMPPPHHLRGVTDEIKPSHSSQSSHDPAKYYASQLQEVAEAVGMPLAHSIPSWEARNIYGALKSVFEAVPLKPAEGSAEADTNAELIQAWKDKKVLQFRAGIAGWFDCDAPHLIPASVDTLTNGGFRIKPDEFPQPPEGKEWHNPENLTPEQVGVSEGWRLLLKDAERALESGTEFLMQDGRWGRFTDYHGMSRLDNRTYRTRRPLPAPPKLVPLEAEDIPAVCWIRDGAGKEIHNLVLRVRPTGVGVAYVTGHSFEALFRDGAEYSEDRRTWKPCSKEAK